MKKTLIIHPFLFAAFPVLFLFAYNKSWVSLPLAFVPLITTVLLASGFLFLLIILLKDKEKAALITSVCLLLFFSYGHFYSVMPFARHRYLLPIWAILFVTSFLSIKRTQKKLKNLTTLLNILAICLVLISLIDLLLFSFKTRISPLKVEPDDAQLAAGVAGAAGADKERLPDIYYIILDRYAGQFVLRQVYNFDNTEFIDYLKIKGFYVAEKSNANYLQTVQVLAATFNLKYINYLGEKGNTNLPYIALIQDNKTWRFLKARGYKFIHFGSRYDFSSMNKFADMNFNLYTWPSDFAKLILNTTILSSLAEQWELLNQRKSQWKRIRWEFEKLAEMPKIKGPLFVFAHLVIPHAPYVFDRDGNFIDKGVLKNKDRTQPYVDQLIFANKKAMALIDKLISTSRVAPVIILQADEGALPEKYELDSSEFDWTRATTAELKEKFGILNAYYLPSANKGLLYPSISPVNNFRLIFNLYFNTRFELLPDRSYIFKDEKKKRVFLDITDRLN